MLVPVGAFEQHGAHLPLDTDTQIAVSIASEAATRCKERGVPLFRAPAIEISASDEHLGFRGTLSIGTESLAHAFVAIARSVSSNSESWSRGVIFVNGHGGNADAINIAGAQLASEQIAHTFWNVSGYSDNDSHAGHAETSLMLHIAPDEVRLDLAEKGNTERLGDVMPAMRKGGVRAVSANGVLGDPRGANAHDGARLFEQNVVSLVDCIVQCHTNWIRPHSAP